MPESAQEQRGGLPDVTYVGPDNGWREEPIGAYDPSVGTMVQLSSPNFASSMSDQNASLQELRSGSWVPMNLTGPAPPWSLFEDTDLYFGGPSPMLVYEPSTGSDLLVAQGERSYERGEGGQAILQQVYDNQTWNLSGGAWTNLTVNGSVFPPEFSDGQWVFDTALGGILFFGSEGPLNVWSTKNSPSDTWLFKGRVWHNVTGSSGAPPPSSTWRDFFYDSSLGSAVLIGAAFGDGPLAFTWEFQGTAGWQNLSASLAIPHPLSNGGVVAYDSTTGNAVAVGPVSPTGLQEASPYGYNDYQLLPNNTLEFLSLPAPIEWELGASGWVNVTESLGLGPQGWDGSMSDDPGAGGLVLTQGFSWPTGVCGICPGSVCRTVAEPVQLPPPYSGDYWIFSAGNWTELTPHQSYPDYTVWYPNYCPGPVTSGTAEGMIYVGVGILVAIAGWIGLQMRKDRTPPHRKGELGP
jgi:hypothetical protein